MGLPPPKVDLPHLPLQGQVIQHVQLLKDGVVVLLQDSQHRQALRLDKVHEGVKGGVQRC